MDYRKSPRNAGQCSEETDLIFREEEKSLGLIKKLETLSEIVLSLFIIPFCIEAMFIDSPLFIRSSGRFLVRLYVPFVIDPVVMPTIDAEVMAGAAVDVPMIKWFDKLVCVGLTWLRVRLGGGV